MGSSSRDEARFRSLYEDGARPIYAYFLRRVEDTHAAQDCTADTFLVAWRRLDRVPDDDRALRWLYGVAKKVLSNHYRSRRRAGRLQLRLNWLGGDVDPTPEGIVLRRHEEQEVLDALHQLRPRDQELLRLSIWEELSNAEIGEIYGCSAHAVAQRRFRATQRLARQLATSGHTDAPTPGTAPRGETA